MEVNVWYLLGWTLYAIIVGGIVFPFIVRMTTLQILEAVNDSKISYLTKLERIYKTSEGGTDGQR